MASQFRNYPACRVTSIFPRWVGKEEATLPTSSNSFDFADHPAIWMSQTSFILDKPV